MSKDKTNRAFFAFCSKIEAVVFITLHEVCFCNKCSFENWGISLGYSPVLGGAYSFSYVTRSD